MRPRLKAILLTGLVLFACLLGGCASEKTAEEELLENILVPKVLEDTYVYDQGQFISDDQEDVINNLLVQLEEKTTIEFAVITIPSLNDLTIEQYAVRLGNELGIGKADKENGILLLVSRADTKVRLEIGPGLQGFLTDSKCGRILDKFFVPSREKDQYDDACFNTVNAVINAIADSEEYEFSGIEGLNKELAVEADESDELTTTDILIIVAVIVFLLILEWITGSMFGYGFGDGIVFAILHALADSSSSGGGRSGGSFGGSRFNGGGSSR